MTRRLPDPTDAIAHLERALALLRTEQPTRDTLADALYATQDAERAIPSLWEGPGCRYTRRGGVETVCGDRYCTRCAAYRAGEIGDSE